MSYFHLDILHFYDESGRLTLRRLWVCINALIQGQHPRSLVRARLGELDTGVPFTREEELLASLVELLQGNNAITHVAGQLKGKPDKVQRVPRPGEDKEKAPGEITEPQRSLLDSWAPLEDDN